MARCSGGSRPEPAFELVPICDPSQLVGRGRPVGRQDPEVGDPAALAGRVLETHVHEQPSQPGVEPVRIAERREATPGDHQRVLEGVLGPVDVSKNPVGQGVEVIRARPDQVDVRLPIPSLGRLDEVPLHRLASVLAPGRGRRPTLLVVETSGSFIPGAPRPSAARACLFRGMTPVPASS
jgi:hypothetical protein